VVDGINEVCHELADFEMSSPITRKQAALRSMARRKSTSMPPERPPVDLAYLVRIYLLDGSSKVLQMKESR
jgi:hypothetical protein